MKITHFLIPLFSILTLISSVYAKDSKDLKGPCCNLDMPMSEKTSKSIEALNSNIQKNFKTPKCFSSEMIKKSKASPERQLAELMKGLSDEEIYTRLILAETMASTCPSKESAEAIAWVIKNRVDAKNSKRFGLGRDVAFKEYQFRSSTGDCDVAQREAFMCPSSVDLEKWKMAQNAFFKTQNVSSKNPIGQNTYQYFFYKHFDKSENCKKWKGVTPAWAKENTEIKVTSLKLDRSCVRIFP